MPLHVLDGYVWLERDPVTKTLRLPDELRERFYPDWLRQLLRAGSPGEDLTAFEDEYLRRVAEELDRISQSRENCLDHGVPVGKSQVKIGDYNVPIKDVLVTGASYSLPIFIAVSALFTGPATLVLAAKAAAAIGPATAKLYSTVTTYAPHEQEVYAAVAFAMYRNHAKTLRGDGATLDEIKESFAIHKRKPPKNLENILNDMSGDGKKMLVRTVYEGVETYKLNT